jgi:hypothetical protein
VSKLRASLESIAKDRFEAKLTMPKYNQGAKWFDGFEPLVDSEQSDS